MIIKLNTGQLTLEMDGGWAFIHPKLNLLDITSLMSAALEMKAATVRISAHSGILP